MKKDDIIIVRIEDFSNEGLGIGYIEDDFLNPLTEIDAKQNTAGDSMRQAEQSTAVDSMRRAEQSTAVDSLRQAEQSTAGDSELQPEQGSAEAPAISSADTGQRRGPVLFIKDTIIGDVAEVKVMKMKKTYGYARLLRILTPSQDRVEAPCPVARPCGGCQIQEMNYEAQLRFKEKKVRGNLQRIGGFAEPPMESIIGMENRSMPNSPLGSDSVSFSDFLENQDIANTIRDIVSPVDSRDQSGREMEYPFRYRNKAQYPIGRDKDGNLIAGFYAGRTHTVIDSRDCLLGAKVNKSILDIVLNHMETYGIEPYDETTGTGLVRHVMIRVSKEVLEEQIEPTQYMELHGNTNVSYTTETAHNAAGDAALTEAVHGEADSASSTEPARGKASGASGQIMVCIVINGTSLPKSDRLVQALCAIPGMTSITLNVNRERTNVIMGRQLKLLWGKEYIEDTIGDICFRISPLSFYQVNPRQTEKLYAKALEYAGLTGQETVWDLYCGIGTISLFLAKNARTVYGVEIIPDAIRDARQNAQLNGITNAEFFVGKAEEVLPEKYEKEGIHADVIVVDPPRKGCDRSVLDTMLKIAPKRIVYVSCDSATLARDLKYLCAGGYELKKICSTDMFANSCHVETVVLMSRIDTQ
ncbi:MAG: 23S rRNA (uracil(1939)-C(5))-methyltransferase RlmD [Lachnospiraceae bacterium]|nr:23S rRNA (uracil(1939)-C(5))-methyltransferase RlmD [Lachnospiraceae bacterium]